MVVLAMTLILWLMSLGGHRGQHYGLDLWRDQIQLGLVDLR